MLATLNLIIHTVLVINLLRIGTSLTFPISPNPILPDSYCKLMILSKKKKGLRAYHECEQPAHSDR